jgi:hypothetical protein
MHSIRWFFLSTILMTLVPACTPPGPGAVSGQVKLATADGNVRNVSGAQIVLRGAQDTRTTISNDGEGDEPEASYNYRFDNVPAGRYVMAVTPPAGSGLQPEEDLSITVEAGETYPQSVLLLPEGVAKPRALRPDEVSGEQVGYVNGRGERVVYANQGGLDTTDFLLMYLLMRNPIGWGYGAPPILVGSPGGSTGPRYRVETPPTRTSTGQTVTRRSPSVPGQGATRPGSSASTSSGTSSGSSANSGSRSSSVSSPSQGASRPSAPSRSSGSSSRSSGSSSGGRK